MAGQQEETRTLRDYATPKIEHAHPSIVKPAIGANNFELKPSLIQMIQNNAQFYGLSNEDPNSHISNFLEICETIKINGVSKDAIRLRLFPFSLKDKAKQWLNSLPNNSITTWDQLSRAFMNKYFPPVKTFKLRNDITNFVQGNGETFDEAWERFKETLRRCPHHEIAQWMQIQIFYTMV